MNRIFIEIAGKIKENNGREVFLVNIDNIVSIVSYNKGIKDNGAYIYMNNGIRIKTSEPYSFNYIKNKIKEIGSKP